MGFSASLPLIITAIICYVIVIKFSKGKISRGEFLRVRIIVLSYIFLHSFLALKTGNGILYGTMFFIFPFLHFFNLTASVKRLKDLGYNPWFILFDMVPFVNLYFEISRWVRNSRNIFNEWDESVDYSWLVKKMGLENQVSVVVTTGLDFHFDQVFFECFKENGKSYYQVSKLELEDNKKVKEYAETHFETVNKEFGASASYKKCFYSDVNPIEKICSDMKAIKVIEEYMIIQDKKLFVSKDGTLLRIVMRKDSIPEIFTERLSERVDEGDYIYILVSVEDLKKIILCETK